MQTILALIFAYLVFVTRTWAITRLVVLIDVGLALLYDFTPLRLHFGLVEPIALGATLLLWAANILVDRRDSGRDGGRDGGRHGELVEPPPSSR